MHSEYIDGVTQLGRGRLQAAEVVVRRRASKAVLGLTALRVPGRDTSQHPARRTPTSARAPGPRSPGDPCPESAEDAGSPAERSRHRGPGFGIDGMDSLLLMKQVHTPPVPPTE
jgi:hypothetical protein